ncbi:hypothetical protein pb186bvf_000742 [Paramecium bursaria]
MGLLVVYIEVDAQLVLMLFLYLDQVSYQNRHISMRQDNLHHKFPLVGNNFQFMKTLIILWVALAIRKWDWINNYNALSCTCPDQCCINGDFVLTDDTVMNTNFISINAKLSGAACTNYTVENVFIFMFSKVTCYFDDPTSVYTVLSCPIANWTWQVSKDNNTGSVFWTDNSTCQGVWNKFNICIVLY